jgi:MOSC domain-containing protein YiiM
MTARLPELVLELLSLRAGPVAPLGPAGVPSAMRKVAIDGRAMIDATGIAGDAQADRVHHGGPDKALHLYPAEHYADWRRELPAQARHFEIGAFGENLATRGAREADLCLGDVFTLGEAIVQVSQGRQPCAKLNLRFERDDMVERVRATRRAGVYFRVLLAGPAAAGEPMRLIERPAPDWPLTRVWGALFESPARRADLEVLAASELLGVSWRERAGRRLAESIKG